MLSALRMVGVVGIQGTRQLAVTAYCVRTFFDAYLTHGDAPRLDWSLSQCPELQVVD